MQCKTCNYPDSRVVETKRDEKTNQVYRRRECIKCGMRYTTQEHFRDNYKSYNYKTPLPKKVLDK
jgi:transcriptional repressor NrdR